MAPSSPPSLPILDLSLADDPAQRPALLAQLHDALFNIGFLYIENHGVDASAIADLTEKLPGLFELPTNVKAGLSKSNSPHFLGYSGFAEETTLGKQDLREQFDFATELPVVYRDPKSDSASANQLSGNRDFSQLYWRLRGPNQWPPEDLLPGFRHALATYHDAVQELSYRFVGNEAGLEVLAADGTTWIPATPVDGTFVVNFGNAFEAATEGTVRATVHRVKAPSPTSPPRYSIPFFQGLPLDMTVSQIRSYIPEPVRRLRRDHDDAAGNPNAVSTFLDPRWDALGESQLRKWIRSHEDVGRKWYGDDVVRYYLS
ncbi:Oxoglutarate/iron-dependent oxygenase [Neofusicoccum parvum]|nr:Oxoglutarate/iron-dependent oxygenase [Neofusicoccum parvum]